VEVVSCVNGLIWFAVIIGFGVRYLRSRGRQLDEANARRVAAESRLAADHAGYATRLAHHRALHDTVLTTLTAVARGSIDHRAETVRRRCGRDADYIRRLLDEDAPPGVGTMADTLADVVEAAGALGLRVTFRHDAAPDEVPREVVDVLGNATREALNNVFKHSGADEAWVTASSEDGTHVIAVVDRGCGFERDRTDDGFGLRHSIVEAVTAVGGRAHLTTAPGAGTVVELTWPK
jgi:signal transduction histidine kinase